MASSPKRQSKLPNYAVSKLKFIAMSVSIVTMILGIFILMRQISVIQIYTNSLKAAYDAELNSTSNGSCLGSCITSSKDIKTLRERNIASSTGVCLAPCTVHGKVDDHNFVEPNKGVCFAPCVTSVSILGERNSGTTWMYDHLNECFNHTISIKRRLTRYKHWFQDEKVGKPINHGTLIIAIFRNPFEWVEAMMRKPHHAPAHMFIKDWKQFVTKPWTMPRVGKDLDMSVEEKSKAFGCQEHFNYQDVISCHVRPYSDNYFNRTHYSEHQPFYELNTKELNRPFHNILELRAAKIHNFLSTKNFEGVNKFLIIQYEALVSSGTYSLIEYIEDMTGVKSICDPSPQQQNRKQKRLNAEFINYLMESIDWDAENMIGYHKTGMRKPPQDWNL